MMKTTFTALMLASLGLAISGAMAGCSAGVEVDPNRNTSHATMTKSDSSSSTEKTVVRDANGNVTESRTEVKKVNP